jgi:hypothetical protein
MFLTFGMPLTVRVTSAPSKKYLAPGPDQVPMVCAPRSQKRGCSVPRPHFLQKVRHRSAGASLPSTEHGEPHSPSVPLWSTLAKKQHRTEEYRTGWHTFPSWGCCHTFWARPRPCRPGRWRVTQKRGTIVRYDQEPGVASPVGVYIMLRASPGTREGFDCGGYARCGGLCPAVAGRRPLGTLAAGWPSRHRGEVTLCVGQDWLCRRGSWPRV